jgi:hypothetical protein
VSDALPGPRVRSIGDVRRELTLGVRRLNASGRMLPQFLIIGARKAGTTSLYDYLTAHPCVAPALKKEVRFFNLHYSRGVSWYRSHFPLESEGQRHEQESGSPFVTGEATPNYLYRLCVPERIREVIPDARLLVVLRNPVDRTYSEYHHAVVRGRESRSFAQAVAEETDWLARRRQSGQADNEPLEYTGECKLNMTRGIYVDWLRYWLRFFPREQLHVVSSEHLFRAPAAALQPIWAFLGVPSWEAGSYGKRGAGRYAPMDPATREELVAFFGPRNRALYEHLGVEYDWDR